MAKVRHAVVVTHKKLRETGTIVQDTLLQLERGGFDVTLVDTDTIPDFGTLPQTVPPETEIVVVLGGDGTILRAAELVHCTDVPIIGINMGHVGFLAEFESFQLEEAIRRICDHDYRIDERMVAHVDVWLPGIPGFERLGLERCDDRACRPRQDGGDEHRHRWSGHELVRMRWCDRLDSHRLDRLCVLCRRADHLAGCAGSSDGAIGRPRAVLPADCDRFHIDTAVHDP